MCGILSGGDDSRKSLPSPHTASFVYAGSRRAELTAHCFWLLLVGHSCGRSCARETFGKHPLGEQHKHTPTSGASLSARGAISDDFPCESVERMASLSFFFFFGRGLLYAVLLRAGSQISWRGSLLRNFSWFVFRLLCLRDVLETLRIRAPRFRTLLWFAVGAASFFSFAQAERCFFKSKPSSFWAIV